MEKKGFKFIRFYGQWAIDEMKIEIVSKNFAYITYEKYVINAYKHSKSVRLHIIDKIKGMTLEDKIKKKFDELKIKLMKENAMIIRRKNIAEKIELEARHGDSFHGTR